MEVVLLYFAKEGSQNYLVFYQSPQTFTGTDKKFFLEI